MLLLLLSLLYALWAAAVGPATRVIHLQAVFSTLQAVGKRVLQKQSARLKNAVKRDDLTDAAGDGLITHRHAAGVRSTASPCESPCTLFCFDGAVLMLFGGQTSRLGSPVSSLLPGRETGAT